MFSDLAVWGETPCILCLLSPLYKHTPLHVFRIGAAVVPVTWFYECNCFLGRAIASWMESSDCAQQYSLIQWRTRFDCNWEQIEMCMIKWVTIIFWKATCTLKSYYLKCILHFSRYIQPDLRRQHSNDMLKVYDCKKGKRETKFWLLFLLLTTSMIGLCTDSISSEYLQSSFRLWNLSLDLTEFIRHDWIIHLNQTLKKSYMESCSSTANRSKMRIQQFVEWKS